MSESAQAIKKQKKDTKIDQWAETKDPFVNQLYKRLRNNAKKINKINEVEQKIRAKEIQPNQEQLEMVSRKPKIKAEMDEVLDYLKVYQESFPDNPAFAVGGASKKKSAKVEVAVVAPVVVVEEKKSEEPAVDVNKLVENAFGVIADAVILGALNGAATENQQVNDALAFVKNAWTGLTSGEGSWAAGKAHFVDVFTRLAFKSATQVGAHTSKSYGELHTFITGANQGLFSQEKPV